MTMNENVKTAIFVGIALVTVVVAWALRPGLREADSVDLRGKPLFPQFEDALAGAALEIVEFDEQTAIPRRFKVARVSVDGAVRWSIPSHSDYPADAENQLASAAANMHGLTILELASKDKGDHGKYGVVDPLDDNATESNAGIRVTLSDEDDRELASLIIGKELSDRGDLHYVRKIEEGVPKDPVYTVDIPVDRFSTDFGDWIEKDLLKLNAFDVREIRIRDHSVIESVMESTMALDLRRRMTLGYDDMGETKWTLKSDEEFLPRQDQWVPVEMAANEELDTERLDDLRDALDSLDIVDVARKPAGLSGDLKAEKSFLDDREALFSLQNCGFYLAPLGEGVELVSNEGEVRCLMDDGVEYVLRFGDIAGVGSAGPDAEEGEEGEDSPGVGMNRYLFVMAEFNPDIIPEPELEPPPEEEETVGAESEETGETATDEATAGEPTTEEAAADDAGLEDAAADDAGLEDAAADGGAADDAGLEDAAADDAGLEDAADDDVADDASDGASEIDAQRERIERENQRKQEEYEDKIEKGKRHVKELNDRFADWYYVISNDVYQKIHLGRDQIVKKREVEETELGGELGLPPEEPIGPLGEFERLREEGPAGSE